MARFDLTRVPSGANGVDVLAVRVAAQAFAPSAAVQAGADDADAYIINGHSFTTLAGALWFIAESSSAAGVCTDARVREAVLEAAAGLTQAATNIAKLRADVHQFRTSLARVVETYAKPRPATTPAALTVADVAIAVAVLAVSHTHTHTHTHTLTLAHEVAAVLAQAPGWMDSILSAPVPGDASSSTLRAVIASESSVLGKRPAEDAAGPATSGAPATGQAETKAKRGAKAEAPAAAPAAAAPVAAPAATSAPGEAAAEEGKAKGKAKAKPAGTPATGVDAVAATGAPVSVNIAAPSEEELALLTNCPQQLLEDACSRAIVAAFPSVVGTPLARAEVAVASIAGKFKHHYQLNNAAALAGKMRAMKLADPPANPREAAEKLVAAINGLTPPCALIGAMEISGPGFINIYVATHFLSARVSHILHAGLRPAPLPRKRRVIVDYSSPNIAKEMHIGHLRSTIIGDAIARILEFAGHDVKRVNHVGDWGTQFGMLIAHLKDMVAAGKNIDVSISDLTLFYKEAKLRFDKEEAFKLRAHQEVVALQGGDETNLSMWKKMVAVSASMFSEVYTRLTVDPRLELCGESFYNSRIPGTIAEMESKGVLADSDGAAVMFVPGYEVPLMVRKSDGGYGYDSTDMAAIRYRLHELNADWLVYVVDAGQGLHFDLVFGGAQIVGWYTAETGRTFESKVPGAPLARVEHAGFGVVQGEDGKKFKTRTGETVRLVDVLDEAKRRVKESLAARAEAGKGVTATDEELDRIASVLGYGGVKYFDLSKARTNDYIFNYDAMLSMEGDTALYLEYAHARLQSILRKASEAGVDMTAVLAGGSITFTHPSEIALAVHVVRFPEVIAHVAKDLTPHLLCEYLYHVAGKTADFHRDCHVLNAESDAIRDSRLRLTAVAARALKDGLALLAIEALDRF